MSQSANQRDAINFPSVCPSVGHHRPTAGAPGAQGGGGDDEERPNKEEETETRERDAEMNAGRRTGRPSVLWTVPLSRRGGEREPLPRLSLFRAGWLHTGRASIQQRKREREREGCHCAESAVIIATVRQHHGKHAVNVSELEAAEGSHLQPQHT